MTHWNYRVIRKKYPPAIDGIVEESLQIHEVYYDENNNPKMVTEEGMEPHGETLDELRNDLNNMIKALDKPILAYNSF